MEGQGWFSDCYLCPGTLTNVVQTEKAVVPIYLHPSVSCNEINTEGLHGSFIGFISDKKDTTLTTGETKLQEKPMLLKHTSC